MSTLQTPEEHFAQLVASAKAYAAGLNTDEQRDEYWKWVGAYIWWATGREVDGNQQHNPQ